MKTIFLSAVITVYCGLFSNQGFAQDGQPSVQKREEIIIRKNDTGLSKTIIEIDSNRITVNGRPLSDFDGNITITRKEMADGGGHSIFEGPGGTLRLSSASDEAFLGVFTASGPKGAVVKRVLDGSSAKKAGLQQGDVITRVGDQAITSPEDLKKAIGSLKAGGYATITYLRNDKKKTQEIELGKMGTSMFFNRDSLHGLTGEIGPFGSFDFSMPREPRSFYFNYSGSQPRMGMKIEDTEGGNGAEVLEVQEGSAAGKAGLKKGDIITEINGEKVNGVNDLKSRIQRSENKNDYRIRAKRNNRDMDFEVHIPRILKSINI